MQTLEQFNAKRHYGNNFGFKQTDNNVGQYHEPIKNKIACPVCKSELYDSMPHIFIQSDLFNRKHIHCENCGFMSHRIA